MTAGKPMCAAWYEHAGSYRPWHRERPAGCTCSWLSAHAPDDQHDLNCPVRTEWTRRELLAKLTGQGDAGR